MTDDPNWADIMSAFGTVGTGVIAAYLSWRAYSLEQKRLRYELYPSKKELYEKVSNLRNEIEEILLRQEGDNVKLSLKHVKEIEDIVMQAPALFSLETIKELEQLQYKIRVAAMFDAPTAGTRKRHANIIEKVSSNSLKLMSQEFEYQHGIVITVISLPFMAIYVGYIWLKRYFRKLFDTDL